MKTMSASFLTGWVQALPRCAVQLQGLLRGLLLTFAAVAAASGEPPPALQEDRVPAEGQGEELVLFAGESRVIASSKARRVAVGDGRVVSAAVLDEREILLMANAPGETTVQVWTARGRSHSFKIRVQPGDMTRISRDLQSYFRDMPNVRTRTIGDTVVLEGHNVSDADRDRIAEIVKRFPQLIDFTSRVGFDRMFAFDVRFVELSRSGLEDLGIDWTTQGKPLIGLEFAGDLYHKNRTGAALTTALDDGSARTEVNIERERLQPFSARLAVVGSLFGRLNLLAQKGDAVILAQPRLAARNRGTASFLAGGEIPVAAASATGTPSVSFREYGIRLEVIEPVADDSGTIRARIRTEVSSLDRSVTVMGVPGLLSRRTETEFNLREGETLVLSGVISREQSSDDSSVPYFGDIPVLGQLFRSSRFQNRQSELVVFLTPSVITPGSETPDARNLEQRAERRLNPPAASSTQVPPPTTHKAEGETD